MSSASQADDLSLPVLRDLGEPKELPTPHREKLRGWMALALLSIFFIEIFAALIAVFVAGLDIERIKNVYMVILPPTTALLGSVAGFYYGSESK